MGARKRRYNGMIKTNQATHEAAVSKKVFAKRLILSLFLTGVTYTASCVILLFISVFPPNNELFYTCQKEVVRVLYEMAKESVNAELQKIVPRSNLSIDGSWAQRRNSRTFILDVIDPISKKIVDFELLDKGSKYRKGNYQGPSNQMEAFAFNKTIERLMKNKNIAGIIKDGDTKLEKIIKNHHWNVSIYYDPNHLKKNFPTLFAKYNKLAGGALKGLKDKILAWINHCLYAKDLNPEEKREKFMTCFLHFIGNHSLCDKHDETTVWAHANDPKKNVTFYMIC